MAAPLAQLLRPDSLSDVFGQHHLLDEGKVFRRIIESGTVPNMVFYGPPGVGKTTVARIISKSADMPLFMLNGTNVTTSNIRDVIAETATLGGHNGVLLYLDEIQYLNKKQQQSLLECLEDGTVTMIASTTENPYFYIYSALLSRLTVFEFKPLDPQDILLAVNRAFECLEKEEGIHYEVDEATRKKIALLAGGDVRKAVNAVNLLSVSALKTSGSKTVTSADVEQISSMSASRYDRSDDVHYDLLSALQKSIRGSDPDATVYYLARILDGGDLISACRRLLVIASEDVGLAYPMAAAVTKSCVDSALQLGLPEAKIPLAEAACLLATAPKSNSSCVAIEKADADIRAGNSFDVPDWLRGTGYSGAEKLGRGTAYKYPHDFPNHWTEQQYLPDPLIGTRYYEFGDNKNEQAAKTYWEQIKGKNSAK